MDFKKPIIRIKNMESVRQNYDYFADRAAQENRIIAPVLKSNAYGFGAKNTAKVLYEKGARDFFTSDACEALEVRKALPRDVWIYTLHGYDKNIGVELDNIYPVLNNYKELVAYDEAIKAKGKDERRAAIVQLNTGMNRGGFCLKSAEELAANMLKKDAYNVDIKMFMTHLCGVELDPNAGQKKSLKQFDALKQFLDVLPERMLSVTATHGSLFIEHEGKMPVKQDVERIGVGLLGDIPGKEFAFSSYARILSTQYIDPGHTVGYDCAYTAKDAIRVAVVDIGYGDGYPRGVSVTDDHQNEKKAYMSIGEYQAPIIGLVAMNMTCIDITNIPDEVLAKENYAEIIGKNTPIQYLADCAKTTPEDILISLNRSNVRAQDIVIKGPKKGPRNG